MLSCDSKGRKEKKRKFFFLANIWYFVLADYNYYMVHMHCENSQENLYSLIVGIDKYCQWNGHNETLWFIG